MYLCKICEMVWINYVLYSIRLVIYQIGNLVLNKKGVFKIVICMYVDLF